MNVYMTFCIFFLFCWKRSNSPAAFLSLLPAATTCSHPLSRRRSIHLKQAYCLPQVPLRIQRVFAFPLWANTFHHLSFTRNQRHRTTNQPKGISKLISGLLEAKSSTFLHSITNGCHGWSMDQQEDIHKEAHTVYLNSVWQLAHVSHHPHTWMLLKSAGATQSVANVSISLCKWYHISTTFQRLSGSAY